MSSVVGKPPGWDGNLTSEQLEFWRTNGYLTIERWFTPETVTELREAAARLIDDFDGKSTSVFTTKEQERTSDKYFLESGKNISFFWEAGAWKDGELTKPKHLAINKIGHAMHDQDPAFRAASYDERVANLYRSLGFVCPTVVQSMYITKQPGIGGEVRPHQDGTFLYTTPQSVVGAWWSLEECTTSNGCLWAVPGSHNLPVHRRFRRRADGAVGTEFDPPTDPAPFDLTGAVPLEMPAGTLVLIHGALVHYSEANASDKSRHAYSIHVVEGDSKHSYPADNWLQRGSWGEFNALYDDEGKVDEGEGAVKDTP
jgi:phytanoyl-CoA hydroxylase